MAKKRIQVMELTAVGFQVFRAVPVTSMAHSTTLAPTVSGGVERRTLRTLPAAAICPTPVTNYTGTSAVRLEGYLSVASGINFTLSLPKGYLIHLSI